MMKVTLVNIIYLSTKMQKYRFVQDFQSLTGPISMPLYPIVLIAPILPGKSEAWRRFIQEIGGSRRSEYEESRHRLGIVTERTWLVETVSGDVAIMVIEAKQSERVLVQMADSALAFDGWLREQLLNLQGIDLTRPRTIPRPDLIFEWYNP